MQGYLTIKELTDLVGASVTPRMVRHYHRLGLMPQPQRAPNNYRLYTKSDVQRLRQIINLKQQGFQLAHVQKLLQLNPHENEVKPLISQLQQQYQAVIQQLARLRQTASALEGLIGRDHHCQALQAEVTAQLQLLAAQTDDITELEDLWHELDTKVASHPEAFQESLQQLLPNLANRSEIEVDLLSKLVLACGDVSLINFVRLSQGAIAAARDALKAGCQIITDVPLVSAALDQTRLFHLGCGVSSLIDDPHIINVAEAEQAFWQRQTAARLLQVAAESVLVIGYAPSVLMSVCTAIEQGQIEPALVIGMPIGFSHAPAAKRRLIRSGVAHITIAGTMGGGLLAAVALNALVASLLEKPNCHCYLKS